VRRHRDRAVSTRHTVTILAFSKTKIFENPVETTGAACEICTFPRRMRFSIALHLDEFRERRGSQPASEVRSSSSVRSSGAYRTLEFAPYFVPAPSSTKQHQVTASASFFSTVPMAAPPVGSQLPGTYVRSTSSLLPTATPGGKLAQSYVSEFSEFTLKNFVHCPREDNRGPLPWVRPTAVAARCLRAS